MIEIAAGQATSLEISEVLIPGYDNPERGSAFYRTSIVVRNGHDRNLSVVLFSKYPIKMKDKKEAVVEGVPT